MKYRMTNHMSRGHANSSKGYSPKHNRRDFDYELADNIHTDQMKNNRYWTVYDKSMYGEGQKSEHLTFEQAEEKYYREHFSKQYEQQQERYRKKSQYKYMKDFEEWMYTKNYCPDECHFQVGSVAKGFPKKKEIYGLIGDMHKLYEQEYREHGCGWKVLDIALHCDEQVPHIAIRGVWCYKDADGNELIGQDNALEQAGYELPKPGKKNRHNNRKMAWSAKMRGRLIDICKSHGLDIEEIPDPALSHHNATKEKFLEEECKKYQTLVAEHEKYINELTEEEKRNIYLEYQQLLDTRSVERARDADKLSYDLGLNLPDTASNRRAMLHDERRQRFEFGN